VAVESSCTVARWTTRSSWWSRTRAGIPPEVRNRLFEPFFTTKPNGTGLGLAIVHSLVDQHGGRVWVDRAESKGAAFHIRLPRA
jgi:two-component system sensor histidine kinase HydH